MIKHIIFDCFGTLINTGNGSIKAVETILSSVGSEADASVEVKPMIQSLFAERVDFTDVKVTLQQLMEKGLDVAIGSTTDTDSLMYYLERNNLSFSYIYTSENMGVYKPNPIFYKTILDRSGWDAGDCLFVGDNYIDDVCGPKKIGMKAVLLDRNERYKDVPLNPTPDYLIQSLYELVDVL